MLFVLACAVTITIIQPLPLISRFKGGSVEMLTRLWLIASLVTTVVITFLANREIVHEGANTTSTRQEWGELIAKASSINMFVLGCAFIVIVLACSPGIPLLLINLLGGIGLVALIMRFDWQLVLIKELSVEEVESRRPNKPDLASCDEKTKETHELKLKEYESKLRTAKTDHETAEDVLFKLDIPILCGLLLTFFIGQLILPSVLGTGNPVAMWESPYPCGFVTGATALQLIVGNVSLEMIRALQS